MTAIDHQLAILARLESELSRYEESGCKTLNAGEAMECYFERAKLRKIERRHKFEKALVEARERKACHMRLLNRATLGNTAVEMAFLRLNQKFGHIQWGQA